MRPCHQPVNPVPTSTSVTPPPMSTPKSPSSATQSSSSAQTPASPAAPSSPTGAAPQATFITQVSRDGAPAAAPAATPPPRPVGGDGSLLLPPQDPKFAGKGLLVLDLDETLVHSSFRHVRNADIILPVELREQLYYVYVKKRPFVQEFLEAMAPHWEVAVFTASVPEYADPLVDKLDPHGRLVHHRLFRQQCTYTEGVYVKDLDRLNRPIERVVIVDNSPTAYLFHAQNALPILSWFDDVNDLELKHLIKPLIELAAVPNVKPVLERFASVLQEHDGRAPSRD